MNEYNYKYGFKSNQKSINNFDDKLSVKLIEKISKLKNEPKWMLDTRLKSLKKFLEMPQPNFGPDLHDINFDSYKYYSSSNKDVKDNWDNIESGLRETFEKVGVIEAEKDYLAGSSSQFDSETIYKNMPEELKKLGVIFSNIETGMQTHPELIKKYFGSLISFDDNKYSALNTAVWSGGSFIYIPKGVKIKKPLQSYFRINAESLGQFERTLIILDDNAELHYIEGCTAPIYKKDNIHSAVVEVFVGENSKCRYTTIQNWSKNVINLVTKRAKVSKHGSMSWVDGNIGSLINMKYPCCILEGDYSSGDYISIASASGSVYQDTGAKMIHIGKNTSSRIISKSISMSGGRNVFRGLVKITKNAINSKSFVQCDSLLIDEISSADALPLEMVLNNNSTIDHEATIGTIDPDDLQYLLGKGIKREKCEELLILGFANEFDSELPMEYAIEFNQLLKQDIENRDR